MSAYCKKCLRVGLDEKEIGQPCSCGGTIEREPEFKELVDALPEPMTCGRRMQDIGPWEHQEGLDHWDQFKSNGDKVCSFCGSLSWDDFEKMVKAAATAPEDQEYGVGPEIEVSDKGYKVYVHRNSVRNAHEGGIKFYHHHLPRGTDGKLDVTQQQQAEYQQANRASNKRFMKRLHRRSA